MTPGGSAPGGPDGPPAGPEPEIHPGNTEDESPSIPGPASSSEPTADGEIHATTQTEQVNEELQEENAETSMDQPSDGSGSE